MKKTTTYAAGILEAYEYLLSNHKEFFIIGQGLWSPWYVGSSMTDLDKKFGEERVIDTPVSESATTGAAVGASLAGMKPIVVHPRMDFMLYAVDSIVNQAAKWSHMMAGQDHPSLTIRSIINRGGEQGAQHSQALHSWFAHIPGLKVVMPSNPADAKGLLIESIMDPNPVIFIEHRWLHNMEGDVPKGLYRVPIGKANIVSKGSDLTIVACSLMVPEALHASKFLKKYNGIEVEVIDLRTIRPIDWDTIMLSVLKTGRLLALDIGHETGSVAAEIIARVSTKMSTQFKSNPERIGLPDFATPTSFGLTKNYYPDASTICERAGKMLNIDINTDLLQLSKPTKHDIPGEWFNGPF